MTVSCTSRSVRSLATASSRGTSPFIGTSLLEVTMMRPGTGAISDGGRKTVWSTPTDTTVMRSGRTCICAAMSWRDPGGFLGRGGRVGQGELPVDRDGVVQGGEQGPPVLDQAQHPVAQALVVVHDVEVRTPPAQDVADPQGVRERLAEPGRAHDGELEPVLSRAELSRVGHPKGVGIAVEVETGHRGEADSLVQLGPRGSGEHLDRVAQGDELAGQVARVDALSAATWVSTIDQEGDP